MSLGRCKGVFTNYFQRGAYERDGLILVNQAFSCSCSSCSLCCHKNLVTFFGGGLTSQGTPFMVTELMDQGSLYDYLHKESRELSLDKKKDILIQIASGYYSASVFLKIKKEWSICTH